MSDELNHAESSGDAPPPAALYFGEVMHARLKPVCHRFSYRVMSLLIDLGRLDQADRLSPLFGVNRASLYSFHEADHGDRDGARLRLYAERKAAERGIDIGGGRVLLLCYPRLLGYNFNPLSVYFCYQADGELALLIYEVRNTFGEMHVYVLPVTEGHLTEAGFRQQQDKLFYVSPFIEMATRYRFRIQPPGESVRLRILETDREGPLLAATFSGRRRSLSTRQLLRSFFALPLVTAKIIAAIHWEALRLWLKGMRLVPRPHAPGQDGLATGKSSAYTPPAFSARAKSSGLATRRLAPFDGSPMTEPISVTFETVHSLLADLPRMVRLTLGYGSKLKRGRLDVILPDGRTVRLGSGEPEPVATMKVHDYGFAARLLRGGDIGIAEAYLRGEWETSDLTQFLYLFCVNQEWMRTMLTGGPVARTVLAVRHWLNRNTKRQARRNIYAHYDIGNAFYSAWLDRSMTYSSALFEDHTADLTAAQHNKYRRLAEAMDLQPGHKLLEIGCGWGGFAEFAAKTYGVQIVALTISREQRDFAQQQIHKAGLGEKVEIKLQDYRDERSDYDRIASIEMIEAVGEQFWPNYFSQLRDRLLPGGRAGIQAITIQDKLFQTYRCQVDFIQRYVFPGGMLPSPQILKSLGDTFGVPIIRERVFGQDYAKTLVEWRNNFREAWPDLTTLGFDDRFRRLWEYYLSYCEAGFLSGNIDVRQVIFAKSG